MIIYYPITDKARFDAIRKGFIETEIELYQYPLDPCTPSVDKLEELVTAQAILAFKEIKKSVVFMDSALSLDMMPGYPGVFLQRSLPVDLLRRAKYYDQIIEVILRMLQGRSNRGCVLTECLAFMTEGKQAPELFLCEVKGSIAQSAAGEMGPHLFSPLAEIFVPQGQEMTLAQMNKTEFESWCRRAKGDRQPAIQLAGKLGIRSAY